MESLSKIIKAPVISLLLPFVSRILGSLLSLLVKKENLKKQTGKVYFIIFQLLSLFFIFKTLKLFSSSIPEKILIENLLKILGNVYDESLTVAALEFSIFTIIKQSSSLWDEQICIYFILFISCLDISRLIEVLFSIINVFPSAKATEVVFGSLFEFHQEPFLIALKTRTLNEKDICLKVYYLLLLLIN